MSDGREGFEQARRNEASLNPRQREVLDLLVAGKTNGEIGDVLGMTLDGAKWNVSEILGKLGLTTREEAAEYWRWRSRPGVRIGALRGLLGLGALKWVGGGAAVVLAVAVVSALTRDDTDEAGGLRPFYLEARMKGLDGSASVGTNIVGADLEIERRTATIRWWNKDIDHLRVEIESHEPPREAGTNIVLADGSDQFFYREETNTYTRTELYNFPPEARLRIRPWSFAALIGPWPNEAASLGEIMEQLRGFRGPTDPERKVEIVGYDTVLGRRTTIVEFSPVSTSSTSSDGQTAPEIHSGTARYWIDEDRLFVMKQVIDDLPSASYSIQVTRLDWDATVPPAKLRFDPPRDARLEEDDSPSALLDVPGGRGSESSTNPPNDVGFATPAGMYRFAEPPEGFRADSTSSNYDAGNRPIEHSVEYEAEDGRAFALMQRFRPGGPIATDRERQPVTVRGQPGFATQYGARWSVTWAEGELVVELLGTMTVEELVALAENLEK